MIKVGDRIEWDSAAHTHTRELGLPNTGRIREILPKGFRHVDDKVQECSREKILLLFIDVDNDTASIGLSANLPDLEFPDDEGTDLLDDLWNDETQELMDILMD